jgi:hypothetical protein
MSPEMQTVIALVVVAIAAAMLVRGMLRKKAPGCGGGCGAVSRDARKLRARLGL